MDTPLKALYLSERLLVGNEAQICVWQPVDLVILEDGVIWLQPVGANRGRTLKKKTPNLCFHTAQGSIAASKRHRGAVGDQSKDWGKRKGDV